MRTFTAIITASILLFSCTEKENGLNVSVMGFVRLYGEKGNEIFDRKDVMVTVKETSSTMYTDENGKYQFTGLKAGNKYEFEFSKDSFGIVKIGSVQFIGEGKPGIISTQKLYKIPGYELLSASLTKENGYIRLSCTTTETDSYRVGVFINDSSNVSDTHYDNCYWHSNEFIGGQLTYFNLILDLFFMNYNPGTTIYAVVFFYNYYEVNYHYPDPAGFSSGKQASQILQVTI